MNVIEQVAEAFGIVPADITGTNRNGHFVEARTVAIVILRDRLELSFAEIGRMMLRDHSSVLHLYRRWPDKRERDPNLASVVTALIEMDGAMPPRLRQSPVKLPKTMTYPRRAALIAEMQGVADLIAKRVEAKTNAQRRERAAYRARLAQMEDDERHFQRMIYNGSVALGKALANYRPAQLAA